MSTSSLTLKAKSRQMGWMVWIGNLWRAPLCTIIPGCLATPLASQKEVHHMDLLSRERSSGGWCQPNILGKVVTINISKRPNIWKSNFSLHLIWFRSDLKCQGDEESLENCPGISKLPISIYCKSDSCHLIAGKENPSCARGEVAGITCCKLRFTFLKDCTGGWINELSFYLQLTRYIFRPQLLRQHPLAHKVSRFLLHPVKEHSKMKF